MGSEPYITVMKNNDKVDFDKIGGTIYLTDNSCKIPVAGRLKCGDLEPANTYLKISKPDGAGEISRPVSTKIKINVDNDKVDLSSENLMDRLESIERVKIQIKKDE